MKKTCYVSMPFGSKMDSQSGHMINFDHIYYRLIKPAVERSNLECIRADLTDLGGVIHKRVLSLVLYSDVMIADLSSHNTNVLYELGIRHAIWPSGTVLLIAYSNTIPFDLSIVPTIHYPLEHGILPDDIEIIIKTISTAVSNAAEKSRVVSPVYELFPGLHIEIPKEPCIFIGHGHSPLWRELKDFIADRLRLPWTEFNSEEPAGYETTERLQIMLSQATFAFLIMTAEEEHKDTTVHARPNVIHEIGLFQGRLGLRRAIVLLEEGCSEFSNIRGLTYIKFPRGDISARFESVRNVLEREKLL
jgi:hypothetical protein